MGGATAGAREAGLGTEARFELESCEVQEGRVVVTGRWHDVRGLRFVRPTLLTGDREVLADLEHKPWDPTADPWMAAFPWDGRAPAKSSLRLSVAPRITVPLDSTRQQRFTKRDRLADALARETELRQAAEQAAGRAERELDATRGALEGARAEREAANAELERMRGDATDERRRREDVEQQLAAKRADIASRQAEFESTRGQLQAVHAELETTRADLAHARAELERSQQAAATARHALEDTSPTATLVQPLSPVRPARHTPSDHELWLLRAVVGGALTVALLIGLQVLHVL